MSLRETLFNHSNDVELGRQSHALATELWPINRSLTGPGVRETLEIIGRELPGLQRHRIASGETAFDWIVPDEWACDSARLIGPQGHIICDFAQNNLHLVGYSVPTQVELSLADLQQHLHSLPEQPDAIPYVTAYYGEVWGFCLTHNVRKSLEDGLYKVEINTTRSPGHLDYADLVIEGETDHEILLSTYVCHPSMANNELSGPVLAHALAKIIAAEPKRHFTYRFVFVPETIGAIIYLSRNLDRMKTQTIAGFQLSCVGDERAWGYVPSRWGDRLCDRVALEVLDQKKIEYQEFHFLQRGSDERQYCAPGVDLPVCSVTRSKYGTFPEYHTSLDDLNFVTATGLAQSIGFYRDVIRVLETNRTPQAAVLGEPQLGKRGLYSNTSKVHHAHNARALVDVLAYADGTRDLLALSQHFGRPYWDLAEIYAVLEKVGLVTDVTQEV